MKPIWDFGQKERMTAVRYEAGGHVLTIGLLDITPTCRRIGYILLPTYTQEIDNQRKKDN